MSTLLKRGSVGDAVKTLQQQLKRIGVEVDEDGVFGPKTEKAVKTLQTASGITADGIFGPNSHAKLDEALAMIKKS